MADKNKFTGGEGFLGKGQERGRRENKKSLTERQATLLDFLKIHNERKGLPPSYTDIAKHFGIARQSAFDYIQALIKKGKLKKLPNSNRGYEIGEEKVEFNFSKIPVIGVIAAGTPILAEENIEKFIYLPNLSVPVNKNVFALRVKGDSMKDIGIMDNDIAVLTQVEDVHSEIRTGNIVAALIDGEATLKTFIGDKGTIYLKPENQNYKDIPLGERDYASIIGKLISSHRTY